MTEARHPQPGLAVRLEDHPVPPGSERDENWHVNQTNIATRKTRDLTPFEKARADIRRPRARSPGHRPHHPEQRNPELFDVYRLNLKGGEPTIDTENRANVVGLAAGPWSPGARRPGDDPDGGTLIRVRDTVKSPWRELMKWGPEETLGSMVGFSEDNKALLILTSLDAKRGAAPFGECGDGEAHSRLRRSSV